MDKKIFAIMIISMLFSVSFTVLPTSGVKVDKRLRINGTMDNTSIKDESKVEYWALCYSQYDSWIASLEMKKNLCNNGWENDHIKTLVGGNLTRQDFIDNLTWIAEREDSDDITLVFIDSHGYDGGFCLPTTWMDYDDLNDQIDNLNSAAIAIFICACHSGSAIPYLKHDGRVIVTSCRANETGQGCNSDDVVLGLAGIGDHIGDNDGLVSVEETFYYFQNQIQRRRGDRQHPCIQDDYPGLLNLVCLSFEDKQVDQKQVYFENLQSVGDDHLVAQSFVPRFDTLTKIKLFVSRFVHSHPGPLTLSIRENLYGENLTSVSVPENQIMGSYSQTVLVDFDFPDVSVFPGEIYYMVLSAPHSDYYNIHGSEEDLYENGECNISYDYGNTWKDASLADIAFVTYRYDLTLPIVKIVIPAKNNLYIFDNKITPTLFGRTIVVGKITIEVNASDNESGISRVEFYIDDELKENDTTVPYTWSWCKRTIFRYRHTIEVIAYDNAGNNASDKITVWKFL